MRSAAGIERIETEVGVGTGTTTGVETGIEIVTVTTTAIETEIEIKTVMCTWKETGIEIGTTTGEIAAVIERGTGMVIGTGEEVAHVAEVEIDVTEKEIASNAPSLPIARKGI